MSSPAADTFTIDHALAGHTLAKALRQHAPDLSWNKVRELCERGKVFVDGTRVTDSAIRIQLGQVIEVKQAAPRVQRGTLDASAIVYVDHDVVVVNKPVGMLSVPYEDSDRDTLIDQTRAALRKRDRQGSELGAVQRLDKETSGVMVFARTLEAKRVLQQQFRVHSIERRYQAIVHGVAQDARHDTFLLRDRGDGLRGSYAHFRRPKGPVPEDAQQAITYVRHLESLPGAGGARAAGPLASLVECQLETGRQHQIRIHLSESGHPLVGERVYIRDYQGPRIEAPRPMLHARTLGFEHPISGKPLQYEVEPPADFAECLQRLRGV